MARTFRLLLILFGFVVCASRTVLAQNQPTPSTETLVRGLDTPWAIDFAPDERIFITERPGRIRIIEHGQLQVQPWAQLALIRHYFEGARAMIPTAVGNGTLP